MRSGQPGNRPASVLRAVRVAQGLTLPQVAERAGIDVGHLSRVERGMAGLSISSLRRLATVLPLGDLERRLAPFDNDNQTAPAQKGGKTRAGATN
jgi:transcriptional regulator with XRE-family HTH domain